MVIQAQITPVTGSFTGTTASAPFAGGVKGFNISLSGFGSATVDLERSFDKGVTWLVVESFTADTERRVDDPAQDIYYRFNVSTYGSGTIVYRISL